MNAAESDLQILVLKHVAIYPAGRLKNGIADPSACNTCGTPLLRAGFCRKAVDFCRAFQRVRGKLAGVLTETSTTESTLANIIGMKSVGSTLNAGFKK